MWWIEEMGTGRDHDKAKSEEELLDALVSLLLGIINHRVDFVRFFLCVCLCVLCVCTKDP